MRRRKTKKPKIEMKDFGGKQYPYVKCPRCEIWIPAENYNMETGEHPDCDKYYSNLETRRNATWAIGGAKMKDRLRIARRAVTNLRKKFGFKNFLGIAHGCVGLLDYIETGDIDKIMQRDLRLEVEKITRASIQGAGDKRKSEQKIKIEVTKEIAEDILGVYNDFLAEHGVGSLDINDIIVLDFLSKLKSLFEIKSSRGKYMILDHAIEESKKKEGLDE